MELFDALQGHSSEGVATSSRTLCGAERGLEAFQEVNDEQVYGDSGDVVGTGVIDECMWITERPIH